MNRSSESSNQATDAVVGAPKSDPLDLDAERWGPPVVEEAELRLELDTTSQEMLEIQDALVGAESEAAVLRAKLIELEIQLHSRDGQIEELSARLRASGTDSGGATSRVRRAESFLRPVVRRLKTAVSTRLGR